MLRTKPLRAALYLPAAVALAVAAFSSSAFGDATGVATINATLAGPNYAGATLPKVAATTVTATADQLVNAVYDVVKGNPGFTPAQIGNIAESALETSGGKSRADINAVAGRIVAAAIFGSNA